ncbi:MAG: hypothetical protein PHO08_20265 [Methylococcales bacterium]|nr:hypothetical protein [Methylococcales bacterium]
MKASRLPPLYNIPRESLYSHSEMPDAAPDRAPGTADPVGVGVNAGDSGGAVAGDDVVVAVPPGSSGRGCPTTITVSSVW